MHLSKDNLPTPIGTLDSLMEEGDTSAKPFKVFVAHNLGNRVFLLSIPMHDFFGMSEVANERGINGEPVAQRKLDDGHANKLAGYILKGLVSAAIYRREINKKPPSPGLAEALSKLGPQPYLSLQPIVANIRTCDPGGATLPGYRMITKEEETACFKVMLSQRDILWIVDGQHRRKGMDLVFEFLGHVRTTHKYPKKGSLYPPSEDLSVSSVELEVWNECNEVARGFCTVSVEVHLGLGIEEERQLFHDLNNLGKKVEASLALAFDSSNPVNRYTQEVLFDDILGWSPIEKDIVNWQEDTGQLSRKDIVAVNAHLFLNKTNINGAKPTEVEPRKEIATQFWSAVKAIPGFGEDKAKLTTVAAQPVVLKALAKLTFDFAFSKRRGSGAGMDLYELLEGIPKIDFSHTNPMWRYYELSPAEREQLGLTGLEKHLPSDDEGYNRDIGKYDPIMKVFRFGAKHNDIYPILGDMIRWKLNLQSRHIKPSEAVLDNL
ncbi:MAG: DNA sulfur modification protein DndB [Sulfuritalea sp.]|nr:DNA sulfur modification protein DndB [Sulfuritalea sp.]